MLHSGNHKINLFDPISSWGHIKYNNGVVSICEKLELTVKMYSFPNDFPSKNDQKTVNGKYFFVSKIIYLITSTKKHLAFLKKHQSSREDGLFLCFDSIPMLFSCILTFNRKPLNLICHNNIQKINTSWRHRFVLCFLKLFQARLVVLEEIFKTSLLEKTCYKNNDLRVLHHPLFKKISSSEHLSNKEGIIISYLSKADFDKGFDIFLMAVSSFLQNYPRNTKIKFNIALGMDLPKAQYDLNFLKSMSCVNVYNELLTANQYSQIFSESTYICLPFRESLSNRCSAIFFEALACEKPIIFSKIELFSFYQDSYGNFGPTFTPGDSFALAEIFVSLMRSCGQADLYNGIKNMRSARGNEKLCLELASLLNSN